ncbi:MAG TPA: hemagglutinin repeat-containing protein, partial [Burkholderiaceae bacterium]|nr:hemagglutinin repeat-containing protein [Burkholderiaceae bacterium]
HAGGQIGVSIGETTGIFLSLNGGKRRAHGNGTTHAITTVDADGTLSLIAGHDALLKGAQARGQTLLADIGHNLTLVSEQDTGDFASKQWNAGFTLVYGWAKGGVGFSGHASAAGMNNNYKSVTQTTGLAAGDGGFQIHVGGRTDLKGAVIASTADPYKNWLDTGSLTWSDIHNEAKYDSWSFSVGGGAGQSLSGKSMAGLTGGLGIPQSHDQSSTTRAGIAKGTIMVRNGSQNLAGLNRNPDINAKGLTRKFDRQELAEQQEMGQVAGYVGMRAAGDIEQMAHMDNGSAGAIALHTVAGAAAAALGGGQATQGALGAAAGEAVLGVVPDQTNPVLVEAASVLAGAMVGGGAGAATANYGELYNYLTHLQREKKARQLATCTSQAACQKVQDYWNRVSAAQSLAMAAMLPEGSYSVDLADANPRSLGFDSLLSQAIAQSAYNGALNPLGAQLAQTVVNEVDGMPAMGPAPPGPTQTDYNRINMALLGPVWGIPAEATVLLGGSPEQVAAANNFGGALFGIAGVKSMEPSVKGGGYERWPWASPRRGNTVVRLRDDGSVQITGDLKSFGEHQGLQFWKESTIIGANSTSGLNAGEVEVWQGVPFINGYTSDQTLALEKGFRPDPSTYLDPVYIHDHLASFRRDGGAFLFTEEDVLYSNFPSFNPKKFVMNGSDMSKILRSFSESGDLDELESALGYDPGSLRGKKLYVWRIDDPNVKMPSGNEGANDWWRPGGYTYPGGKREAVLNDVSLPHDKNIDSVVKNPNVKRVH